MPTSKRSGLFLLSHASLTPLLVLQEFEKMMIENMEIISFDPILEKTVPVDGILGEYPLLITGISREEIVLQ